MIVQWKCEKYTNYAFQHHPCSHHPYKNTTLFTKHNHELFLFFVSNLFNVVALVDVVAADDMDDVDVAVGVCCIGECNGDPDVDVLMERVDEGVVMDDMMMMEGERTICISNHINIQDIYTYLHSLFLFSYIPINISFISTHIYTNTY